MGRRRQTNLDLPPRMQVKAGTYYYVTSGQPRKWINLGRDKAAARRKWAELEDDTTAPRYRAQHHRRLVRRAQ